MTLEQATRAYNTAKAQVLPLLWASGGRMQIYLDCLGDKIWMDGRGMLEVDMRGLRHDFIRPATPEGVCEAFRFFHRGSQVHNPTDQRILEDATRSLDRYRGWR